MNAIVNQILKVLASHVGDVLAHVNVLHLALVVFDAEKAGEGTEGALQAVIDNADTLFPDPRFRDAAVALLARMLPHVAGADAAHLPKVAARLASPGTGAC